MLFYISVEPDDCFRFVSVNHAFLKATGLTEDQIIGKRIEEVIPEQSIQLVLDNYRKAIKENRIVRWEETSVYPSGEKIGHVSVAPILSKKGIGTHLVGSMHDITERKQMEISLHASREKAEALAANLISSQEAGSARLARELHDDIIQRLAFLKIEVDKLGMNNPSLPEPEGDKLRQIARDIGVLSSDIHLISRRLHPISLEILGLVRSIETECQNFTRLNEIPVTWDLNGTVEDPSKEISLCAYRILQEGLRNIVRHAKATGVHVTLSPKNGILHLLIKDNGIGFDPASEGVKTGLGIASMTERARLLQGSLSIESRPGKGTAIKLAVPLES